MFAVDVDEYQRHPGTLLLAELQQVVADVAAGLPITHSLQLKPESLRVRTTGGLVRWLVLEWPVRGQPSNVQYRVCVTSDQRQRSVGYKVKSVQWGSWEDTLPQKYDLLYSGIYSHKFPQVPPTRTDLGDLSSMSLDNVDSETAYLFYITKLWILLGVQPIADDAPGDLFTNGRTTVILRTPVVRHRYRTISYSRKMAHLRLAYIWA